MCKNKILPYQNLYNMNQGRKIEARDWIRKKPVAGFFFIMYFFLLLSCKKEAFVDYGGFPEDVGEVFLTRCATSGCHTDASREGAAGLSIQSWKSLFEGSRYGNAAVIPFSAESSYLTYFINTFPELGPTLSPLMPVGGKPLTKEEVNLIKNWINAGAPARNGLIPFGDLAKKSRMFIINQGCDKVYIVDAKSGLTIRSVDVGNEPAVESPHYISISPDDQYFYVCFSYGKVFQKFRTSDGTLAGQAFVGLGQWDTFTLTEDGKTAFVVSWAADGKIAVVDTESMQTIIEYKGSGLLKYPHGSSVKGNWLYVTAQTGNFIYKIDITNVLEPEFYEIPLGKGEIPSSIPKYDAHQIHFSPNKEEYCVSCQRSNELRFFKASNDSLIAVVKVGKFPQHPHYSETTDYLVVTCMEDDESFPGKVGSVSIVNYKTHTFIKNVFTGFQPHGNIVDDENKVVYVLNRNISPNGPAPHHSSNCQGRNGYLTKIDLNTLELVPGYKAEMSVDPYYGAITGHFH